MTAAAVTAKTRTILGAFFRALFADARGVIELRAFPSKDRTFAPLADLDLLLDFLAAYVRAEDCYFGVAARRDESSGKLDNCTTLSAIFADLDFKMIPEPDARRRVAACPLPPSLVVHSGHGLHVYYLLREPLDLATDAPRARALLERMAAALGGDRSAAEPARVLRVPETWNRKAEPVRVALEVCEPDRRYNPSELEEWLPALTAPADGAEGFHAVAAVGVGERHLYLFRLARSQKAKGLDPDAVLAAARVENAKRCTPPLPDAEVVRQVHSAFGQADRPGFEPRSVLGDNGHLVPAVSNRAARTGLIFTRLTDLLHEPEETTAWLVDGRLPTGGLSLLAGKPKAGKSTLARCLALAVARGEAWLGWPTVKGPVFYLALEEKRAEVRRHFQAMGATEEDVRVFAAPSPEDGLPQLRDAAAQEKPALIIVDPLLRFVRLRDANDYAAVTQALEPLLTLARDTDAHLLAVHHLGKVNRDGGDGIIGSTAFFAAVDTALLLRWSEQYRTLSTIQRYGDNLEEITLTLDPVTRWVSAGPSRREADQAKMADSILEYLAGQSEPVEESAIDEAVEGRKAVKVKVLRALLAERQVVRTGAGRRGDPYRYARAGGRSADSSSLVPSYIREPGNQKPEIAETPRQDDLYSRSRENAPAPGPSESRERESAALAGAPADAEEEL
jgi:hypothetical protein